MQHHHGLKFPLIAISALITFPLEFARSPLPKYNLISKTGSTTTKTFSIILSTMTMMLDIICVTLYHLLRHDVAQRLESMLWIWHCWLRRDCWTISTPTLQSPIRLRQTLMRLLLHLLTTTTTTTTTTTATMRKYQ